MVAWQETYHAQWAFNDSALFFDTDTSIVYMDHVPVSAVVAFAFRAGLLVVAGAGLVILWRKAGRIPAAFVSLGIPA